MKKQMIATTMAAALIMSALMVPSQVTWAAAVSENVTISQKQSDILAEVEADLKASANYMMTNLENTIFAADYQISYTDYQDAMFALKAGAENDKVIGKLNAVLKEKLAAYDETFLNPYASTGVQTFALAAVTAYLQEQGVDVTAYEGINLLTKLEETFFAEAEPNPYVYQYISAIAANTDKLSEKTINKVKTDVLSYYVSSEAGTGIDYWGVSADNNGQVLTALVDIYGKDADVKSKAAAALDWNASQKDASGAIVSWGAANASATAMAMRAAAQFGRMDEAEAYYKAMEQFRSTVNDGAYTYSGEDSIYSSRDALTGLLAYRNALQGKDLFAITDRQEPSQPTQKPQPSEKPVISETPVSTVNTTVLPLSSDALQQPLGKADSTASVKAPKTKDASRTGVLAAVMAVSGGAFVLMKDNRKKRYE